MDINLDDVNAYRREIMRLQNCLSLAVVYQDQNRVKISKEYVELAKGYFNRIVESLD